MFFNRNKRIAEQIGIAVSNSLRVPFALTEYITEGGQFNPPKGFFIDPYILAFINGLTAMMIAFDFQGQSWSAEKKGIIVLQVFLNLAGEVEAKKMSEMLQDYVNNRENPEILRGVNDAQTVYGALTGRIRADDPDPILLEARKLAKSFEILDFGFGIADANTNLGMAVSQLTINKHIEEKFLLAKSA